MPGNQFKPSLPTIREGREPKLNPTLPTIPERHAPEMLLDGISAERQTHWGAIAGQSGNGGTGICGGFAVNWLEHRLRNRPVRENQFDSHEGLRRIAEVQAAQRVNNISPMIEAANLRQLGRTFKIEGSKCNEAFPAFDKYAMYISLGFVDDTYHSFAMDTREAEIQFADAGAGIYQVGGWTMREVFDFHVKMLEEGFGSKVDSIHVTPLARTIEVDPNAQSASSSGSGSSSDAAS